MSVARIHYVKHARQLFTKVPKTNEAGERVVTPVMRKSGQPKLSRKGRPIVRRISVADKTKPRELLKCGKCGVTINLGDPYRWFTVGFRSSYKQVRCMKSECTPRPSQLESSSMRADIMSAIEGAEDDLARLDVSSVEVSDVEEIVQQVAEAFNDAASAYREADEAFGGGGNTENGERADTCESSASDLESWSFNGDDEPDFDECDEDVHKPVEDREDPEDPEDTSPVLDKGDTECDNCTRIRGEWGGELIDAGIEAINEVEQP